MNPYDRADHVADAVSRILLFVAGCVFAGYILRAALNFDSWKWMVSR